MAMMAGQEEMGRLSRERWGWSCPGKDRAQRRWQDTHAVLHNSMLWPPLCSLLHALKSSSSRPARAPLLCGAISEVSEQNLCLSGLQQYFLCTLFTITFCCNYSFCGARQISPGTQQWFKSAVLGWGWGVAVLEK